MSADTSEQAQAFNPWVSCDRPDGAQLNPTWKRFSPWVNSGVTCMAGVDDDSPCPNCQERGLWRESVDVGVGTIYGPYGCECGWSEDGRYDRRHGPAKADEGYTEHACDQWGMGHWVGPKDGHGFP